MSRPPRPATLRRRRPGVVTHPTRVLLSPLRPVSAALLRRRYNIREHGIDRVPATGPVILAANHIGLLDGPFLAIMGPRPVHALTKSEMFHGVGGRFLQASGQIRLERFAVDVRAMRVCRLVLEAGHCVGVFPEGTRGDGEFRVCRPGAAYLALVSGAPVVPVAFFGSRAPGAESKSMPPRPGAVDIVYGDPWQTEPRPWPRTRSLVAATNAELHRHLRAAVAAAKRETGRELPGPLPVPVPPGIPTSRNDDD